MRILLPFTIRSGIRTTLLFVILSFLLISKSSAQPIGERVGPQFPFIMSSARLAALADACTPMVDEFSGYGSNPGTLGMVKKSAIAYGTQRVEKGVTFEHAGITYKASQLEAIAFNFEVLHFGGIDFYSSDVVRKLGYEVRTGISYGRLISEGFSAGINLQALTSTTGPNSAWAFMGDIGVIYSPGKYIRYALALKGLGSDYNSAIPILTTDFPSSRLTKVLSLGLLFDFPFDDQRKKINVLMQNDKILGEQSLIYRFGVEYLSALNRAIRPSFRGGFIIRGLDIEPRFGLGLGYQQFTFDYGYRYSKRDNQPSHFFTLAFLW